MDNDLVTTYIEAHRQWCTAYRNLIHQPSPRADNRVVLLRDALDALSRKFTAAHWRELHARRG